MDSMVTVALLTEAIDDCLTPQASAPNRRSTARTGDQQPEQIATGNDGTGNGEIPKPLMFTKELFHNNPRTLKNFSRLSYFRNGDRSFW